MEGCAYFALQVRDQPLTNQTPFQWWISDKHLPPLVSLEGWKMRYTQNILMIVVAVMRGPCREMTLSQLLVMHTAFLNVL